MARKSLILYVSITGNTEKVASRFKWLFEKNGWECDMLKVDKNMDFHDPPYKFADYDFICIGSPVIDATPAKEIFEDNFGKLMSSKLFKGGLRKAEITESFGTKKGIAFVTYNGGRHGPGEALPSLNLIELQMEDYRIKCVGKFSCPGKTVRHYTVEDFAKKFGWTIVEALAIVTRYWENPQHPEFTSLSDADRKLYAAAAGDSLLYGAPGVTARRIWHWDTPNRPSERDLLKAQIFLEEIIEDYYGGETEAAPIAQYVCVA